MSEVNILVVIDPTALDNPVHGKILDLQRRKPSDSRYHLLFIVDPDGVDTCASNENICVDAVPISHFETPFKELGLGVSSSISWSHEWADTILAEAKRKGVDFIAVSHPGKEKTQLADNYWSLIRKTTRPLLIVNPSRAEKSAKVLMAMDLQDTELNDRNKRIYDSAMRACTLWDAEPHIVNAYSDSTCYPDRGRLVNASKLPNENVHLVQGEPAFALKQMTQELNPFLLVIGATRKNTGIRAALRGVKVARMFNAIEHDIMVVT